MPAPVWLLLISALVFLGTIGHLVVNASGVAAVFGKRPREADPGDLIRETGKTSAQISKNMVFASLALHGIGLLGMAVAIMMMVKQI